MYIHIKTVDFHSIQTNAYHNTIIVDQSDFSTMLRRVKGEKIKLNKNKKIVRQVES